MTVEHDATQRALGRVEGKQDAADIHMTRFEDVVSEGFRDLKRELAEMKYAAEARGNALAARLEKIEASEQRRNGALVVLGAIGAFIVTGIGWVVGFFK